MANLNEPIINDNINDVYTNETNIQTFHDRKRRKFACKTGCWIVTNIITFIIGYYIKSKYYIDDCSSSM